MDIKSENFLNSALLSMNAVMVYIASLIKGIVTIDNINLIAGFLTIVILFLRNMLPILEGMVLLKKFLKVKDKESLLKIWRKDFKTNSKADIEKPNDVNQTNE